MDASYHNMCTCTCTPRTHAQQNLTHARPSGALEAPLGSSDLVRGHSGGLNMTASGLIGQQSSALPLLQPAKEDASSCPQQDHLLSSQLLLQDGSSGSAPAQSSSSPAGSIVDGGAGCGEGASTPLNNTPAQQQQQQQLVMPSPMRPTQARRGLLMGRTQSGPGSLPPLLSSNPVPPVTLVFTSVEGAKMFASRRRHLAKEVHAHLSPLLLEAARHVGGGYLCRMQPGDLKYMAAFATPLAALEWCGTATGGIHDGWGGTTAGRGGVWMGAVCVFGGGGI